MLAIAFGAPLSTLRELCRPVLEPRVRRYATVTFFVDAGLIFALLVAVQSYLPNHHETSVGLAGYVLAAYGAAKLVGQLAAGWLIDRINPRRGLIAGLCVSIAGQTALLLGLARSEALLPAAALYGMGAALVWPSVLALATAEFAEDERARLTSGMTIATGAGVGTALSLGFLLPEAFPYWAAIFLSLLSTAAGMVAARRLLAAVGSAEDTVLSDELHPFRALRTIIEPRRLAFSAIILLQGAVLGATLAVFRSYGENLLHVSMRKELLILAPAGVAGALAVLVGGSLADRFGRIPVLGAGYLLLTFSVWSLSTTGAVGAVIPLSILAAVSIGLALPCTSALSMDLARGAATGTLLGWFLTMEGAGHAAGPALAGLLNETGGTISALWLIGGIAALIALIALVPPFWAVARKEGGSAHHVRGVLSGTAKGMLVFSIALPVIATYLAWDSSSQIYGDMVTHGPRNRMEVAITFDDGPTDPWSLQMADVLDRYNVEGTFFTIGQNVTVHPEIVQELEQRGHLIGNHSFRHKKRDVLLDWNYGDMWKAERAIASAAGVCPALYRPPNGFHTPWQLRAVAHHHMKTVTWDVIPRDWKNPPADQIVTRVLDSVKPGSIILLHDGDDLNQVVDRSATLAALPGIIEGLRARGYEFVRLDHLLSVPAYLPTCDGVATVRS